MTSDVFCSHARLSGGGWGFVKFTRGGCVTAGVRIRKETSIRRREVSADDVAVTSETLEPWCERRDVRSIEMVQLQTLFPVS